MCFVLRYSYETVAFDHLRAGAGAPCRECPGSSDLESAFWVRLLVGDGDRRGATERGRGLEGGRTPEQHRGRVVEAGDPADVEGPVAEDVDRHRADGVARREPVHVGEVDVLV